MAAAFVVSGLEPGDPVALWAPNTWEWVVAGLAVQRAGGVLVPVNTRFRGREAAFVLRKSRARALLTVTGFLGVDYVALLREAAEELPDLRDIVVLRGDVPEGCIGADELLGRVSADDLASRSEVRRRSSAVTPEDTSLIMFTSGTTGMPKGAQVRGGAILRAFQWYAAYAGVREGDRYLVVNPFFHAFGFNGGIIPCLMSGATIVPLAVWDVAGALAKIQAERITVFPGPPALYQGMLNHAQLDDYDLSSLRSCVTGAATIPEEMVHQMKGRLGFETVITAYGMTETSGLATLCRPEDDAATIAQTSGRAVPGVELRVVDGEGNDVEAGQPGELLVRGYQIMAGYLDDPEQTAEAIDADGWLHTGDVAVMDERGYIDITDRMKDMFIVGGFNAYPAEIERMMIEHPQIGQVAVVGLEDERLGEVGGAFVVPAPGEPPTPEAIIAWCREHMANYKVPRQVWLVESLPLNPSGKVLKYELRERARQLAAEQVEGGPGRGRP
jgi:acyl-CoA synthetase (AMP-forming)/AMP-acid ligase II